ncbi:kelch-like protein 40b isoform X2 [Maniola jurtina]|uniref:kelch-like protein 40b isoform X2 n=1 Tax=Maniola jurtina TaxID=191418 RepID=UPI001E687CED|nr:kelch-like protein 40b isoform X2 [Maniola jurtina]
MEEVSLRIGNKILKANKDHLCEYSDYFRAMFSGNFAENEKQEIKIDMLDANVMSIILKYMKMGIKVLYEYPLSINIKVATAADYLQIPELIKEIQYVFEIQLSESNWLETMAMAENACYSQLEQYSAAYGLFAFNSMKPEYIPTIHKLVWYLSHPYLDSRNEMQVFKLGFKWLFEKHKLEHTLLILACLDMTRVTNKNLMDMREFLSDYISHFSDSLVLEIIDCLLELHSKNVEISELSLCKHKTELPDKFSERVWTELMNIVKHSRTRLMKYVPIVPLWPLKGFRPDTLPYSLYTFEKDKGFEKYLDPLDKNLWGCNFAAWGLTKLVVVCGVHGRGTGIFMKDVKVYDTLKKTWRQFGVQLPPRRHAGVTVVGDLLYIVGGVTQLKVVLNTAVVFDLKKRSCRRIANLPDAIKSPAVCTHNNKVYMAGHQNIYCYETHDNNKDYWELVVDSEMKITVMVSYGNYIYFAQSYSNMLYRFRPGIDNCLTNITSFCHPSAAMCNSGDCLTVFTQKIHAYESTKYLHTVIEYKEEAEGEKPRVIFTQTENKKINPIGSCSLVLTMPPLFKELPQYHSQYLMEHCSTYMEHGSLYDIVQVQQYKKPLNKKRRSGM